VLVTPLTQERADLEEDLGEPLKRVGRQGRVQVSNPVFVEPERLLDLEANPGDGRRFGGWEVEDEPAAKGRGEAKGGEGKEEITFQW
jgi:hypothetical protein